ncbi:MAG: methyltransferase [Pseudomonadota bacterium]
MISDAGPQSGGPAPASPDIGPRADAGLGPLRRWRNALLASPRFQAFAAAFPLTRPTARKNAQALFGLCTGFVHSQVLLACVQLDLFSKLSETPLTPAEVSAQTGLPLEGTDRLMRAAASLTLFHALPNGRYTLGDMGAALLGNPSVFSMIRHHGDLYKDLSDPLDLLRERSAGTRLARYWRYGQAPDPTGANPTDVTDYSALMAETQGFIAADVLAAYPFNRHRSLMDVGGGNGAFLAAAGAQHPHLARTLCDLPAVTDLARERFAGTVPPVRTFGLNARTDPLPDDTDLITLIRILHDHDDADAMAILTNIRRALPHGGTLLIAEPMAETRGAEPMGESYFGLYLWAMGSGRPRSARELEAMLREAGFTRTREHKTHHPLLVRCLSAR